MKKSTLNICLFIFAPGYLFSQNVGIGTKTPTRARLEVHGVSGAGATSAIFGGDGNGISLQRNWPTIGFNQYRDNAVGNGRYISTGYAAIQHLDPGSGYLAIDMLGYGTGGNLTNAGTRALAISPLGNIGLGGAPANAPLQFPNNFANRKIVLWESANNEHQFYGFGIDNGTLRYAIDAPGAGHRFYAAEGPGSSRLLMTIGGDRKIYVGTQNGGAYLGINTSSITHTLSLRQAGGTGLYLEHAANPLANWEFYINYHPQTDATPLMLRWSGVDVGFFRGINGEYVSYSDQRLKTNVRDMSSVLDKVMQLKPKLYEMKANNSAHEKSMGFIAQDVEPLFPQLVFTTNNERQKDKGLENLMGISYSNFGIIAIKAIQEQQTKMDLMQKEIDLLKEQNKMLIELMIKK